MESSTRESSERGDLLQRREWNLTEMGGDTGGWNPCPASLRRKWAEDSTKTAFFYFLSLEPADVIS